MKTVKSYRLSNVVLDELKEIKSWYPDLTETEIIEKAIVLLNAIEGCKSDVRYLPVRLLDGRRIFFGFEKI